MAPNTHVFDVTEAAFETEVLQASLQTPILLDFWAEWCGPCKSLGPALEQLAAEFNGAFRLAKVDVEANQQLAAMFGIQSIPTVVLVKDGQLADGFAGALPPAQVREFLAKHDIEPTVPADEPEPATDSEPAADPQEVLTAAREAVTAEPANDERKLDLAIALLMTGNAEEARPLLTHLPANLATDARAQRAQSHLVLLDSLPANRSVAELLNAAANGEPQDLHAAAVAQLLHGEPETGLELLIDLLRTHRSYQDDLARRTLINAFRILPDTELVARYRRKMSSLLF
ncbi:thioredoxin [Aquilutibacter rugosus]|uniref:thioredoxin n=1 Tax=Aquilutibacter rugosus TaxID=3115820 RepID=UPI002F42B212